MDAYLGNWHDQNIMYLMCLIMRRIIAFLLELLFGLVSIAFQFLRITMVCLTSNSCPTSQATQHLKAGFECGFTCAKSLQCLRPVVFKPRHEKTGFLHICENKDADQLHGIKPRS